MSRLVAAFNRDGCPVHQDLLARMIQPLRHCATAGPRYWSLDAIGLVYQCLRDYSDIDDLQPATGDSNVALCFDGRLDNREELCALLASDLRVNPATASDAALALAAYLRFGEPFASHLNGDFSLAVADSAQERLILARDPLGIRPLYFWASPAHFLAGSEIKAILAHPDVEARPDELTIADVLVGGDPNGLHRTFFQSIRRALPGHTVVVTRDRIREFCHWDFDVSKQVRYNSLSDYAEGLRAVFSQAVRRRLRSRGRTAVTVSGGLDSSAIFCQAEKLRQSGLATASPAAISLVFPDGTPADEKNYLEDIEDHYDIQIHRLHFDHFQYADEEKWLKNIEYPRLFWNTEFEVYRCMRETGCTTLLDGYFGDQMMASLANLFELVRSFRWRKAHREFDVLSQFLADTPRCTLRRETLNLFLRDLAPDWLMRPYRSLRRLRNSSLYPRWYSNPLREVAYQRSQQQCRPALPFASKHSELCYRCVVAPHRLDTVEQVNKMAASFGIDKAYPFMDRDLISFVMSLPSHVMNWEGVYKGLFREAMTGILPEAIRCRTWKADFTALNSKAAAKGYPRFTKYVRPDCMAAQFGFLDPGEVQRTFGQHRAHLSDVDKRAALRINSVVGLELWLRAYFVNPNSAP